ncbi:hypothetical protein V5O48_007133 [Marasmius crinis-equi]|uniref:Uncharacterized protein n=1 Tax=Marasmius crinis-equi TaxID=585013 RepID=A0ABR3FHK5_9AGAR
MPNLWTTVCVDTSYLANRSDEGSLSILQSVLSMTRGQPLDIKIMLTPGVFNPPSRWQPLLDVLREKCNLWRSLCFSLASNKENLRHYPMLYFDIHPIHPGSTFDSLESVELRCLRSSRYQALIQALEKAPKLNRAALLPFTGPFTSHDRPPNLPWRQISYLEIDSPSFGITGLAEYGIPEYDILTALAECSSLHTLIARDGELRAAWTPPSSSELPQHIRIETLRRLEVYVRNSANFAIPETELASRLTLPNLEHLSVHCVRWEMKSSLASLTDMLKRSECVLETLSIVGLTVADVTVERLLRSPEVGMIKRLEITGQPFKHLFDSLAAESGLLSQLEELDIHYGYEDGRIGLNPSVRAVVQLIRARKQSQLKHVNLGVCLDSLNEEEIRAIRELEGMTGPSSHSGLVVDIQYLVNTRTTMASLTGQIHAIRQLGMLLKGTIVLSELMQENPHLYENMPIVNEVLTKLEERLHSIELADGELMWLGGVQYVLLAIASGIVNIPRDTEFHIAERAQKILEKFQNIPRSTDVPYSRKGRRSLFKLKAVWSKVRRVLGQKH